MLEQYCLPAVLRTGVPVTLYLWPKETKLGCKKVVRDSVYLLCSVNRPADFQYSVSRGDIPPADFDSLLTENTIWNVARIA